MSHPIPDEALDADIAILGKKGRGKTYTAKGIVERLLEMQRRVVVLDPLSTWWGLRTSADGETAGYPVAVFGGPHGDVPLTDKMGTALAETLAGTNLPAVIDLGEMTKAATVRFARDFLAELYRKNRDPIWLVLEEADLLAPQNPMGDTAAVLGEVDRIARRGRNFGFRLITLTQRPARLHKDVLTQLSTLIAMGVSSPQDRDAIKAWVEGNADRDEAKKVTSSLASLSVGEGWVWAPDHDILKRSKFPAIKTLDTSRTPKVGEKRIAQVKLAEVDLSAIEDALASEPEPKSAESKAPSQKALKDAEKAGYERGIAEGEDRGFRSGYALALHTAQNAVSDLCVPDNAETTSAPASPLEAPKSEAAPVSSTKPRAPKAPLVDGDLTRNAKSLLTEACRRWPMKMTWAQLASLTGRKARGGSFNHARRQLLDRKLVNEEGPLVKPSPDAFDLIGVKVPGVVDIQELRDGWLEALPNPANVMLETLFNFYPGSLTKEMLAKQLNKQPRGGSWNTGMKMLRDNDLITDVDGELSAAAILFGGTR